MAEGDNTTKTSESDEKTQPKMVPESDLISVKKGMEHQIDELKTSHAAELEGLNSKLSDTNTNLVASEAKAKDLEERLSQSNISAEELSKVKKELGTAQTAVKSLTDKTLEYRRRIVALGYGIPEDTIKDKTLEQLDAFEEALRAVSATKGIGNYALTQGGGGGATETPIERAKAMIAEAEKKMHYGSPNKE